MFDFGLGELLLVGVVALIVIGPERLPKAARMAGNMVGKLQRLVSSVKQELNTQIELEELRKAKQEFESAASQFKDDLKDIGGNTQNDLNEISDGLKRFAGFGCRYLFRVRYLKTGRRHLMLKTWSAWGC